MKVPIAKELGRIDFVKIAELQDNFIASIYAIDHEFILHGGTAIWRCYSGNRFSYDVDGYIRSGKELGLIEKGLAWSLSKRGLRIDKFSAIGTTVRMQVSDQETHMKVEFGMEKKPLKPIDKAYERTDGTLLNVLTFTPEQFITEKIAAYESRRYIRDLYDIYFLINQAKVSIVSRNLKNFIKNIEPPINENELKNIVYRGIAPSYKDMVEAITGKL